MDEVKEIPRYECSVGYNDRYSRDCGPVLHSVIVIDGSSGGNHLSVLSLLFTYMQHDGDPFAHDVTPINLTFTDTHAS